MSSSEFPIDPIAAAVRKKCAPAIYAQGTKLAAAGVVAIVREDAAEATLTVVVPGWETAPTVVLYADGPEWACDCGGSADPCPHVAAATIAIIDARKRGASLATAGARGHVGYRFARRGSEVELTRVIVSEGRDHAFDDESVASRSERNASDRAIERALGTQAWNAMSADKRREVMDALVTSDDVRLDGAPVKVLDPAATARGVVTAEKNGGFSLLLDREKDVREVLGRGVVATREGLRAIRDVDLCGEKYEKLPRTRSFNGGEVVELVLDVLPTLEARIPIDTRGAHLPKRVDDVAPHVQFALAHVAHTMSVVPRIVYGDPPVARIEKGKTVLLGDVVPVRKPAAETALVHRLRDALGLVIERRSEFSGVDVGRFAKKLRAWDAGEGDRAAAAFGDRELVPRFIVREDGFDLDFELPEGTDAREQKAVRASAAAVLHAHREGIDLVPLEGGGWAPLPNGWIAKYGHLVADLVAAREDDGRVAPALKPALAELCDALDVERPPALAKLTPLAESFEGIPHVQLPEGVNATLRPYQTEGVDWLCFLRDAGLGAVLADDMGLGKTLQTICAVRGRTLVVCPRSVVHNWLDEIRRFRPSLRVAVYHGANRKLDPDADVTLTTYAVLRIDTDVLKSVRWSLAVLDEAQAIKNPDSQAARAAYALDADARVALSGTPVENHLDELWSLFHFSNRGLLGARGDFDDRYAAPIRDGNEEALERLRTRVRPFLLRRLKRDVAKELPPRTDMVMHCELSESERAVYDAVRAATRKQIVEALSEGGAGTLAALEALLRLRQAACHPSLVPGQHAETSAKVERLVHALSAAQEDGHRALVFSQWTSMLDLIEPALRERGIPFARLDGQTRDRAGVVRDFQSESGPPVLLASLKAGGTGLNLTAADHVFLIDPWWNPAVEDQAADRAHRIGQTRPVLLYRLVATDTVEERILALQARKRSLAEAVLEGGAAAGSLTRDDLLALVD